VKLKNQDPNNFSSKKKKEENEEDGLEKAKKIIYFCEDLVQDKDKTDKFIEDFRKNT